MVAIMPSANGCGHVGADITSPPHLCSWVQPHPLHSISGSLPVPVLFKARDPPSLSPCHCVASVCLAACVSVRVCARTRACASVCVCASALKKRRQPVGELESGDRETGGRREASEEGERQQEWETAMKFVQAICVLLLCPALSINSR